MPEVNWTEIAASAALTTALMSFALFLAKEALSVRIKESVAHEYSRLLESEKLKMQWDSRRREQATKVAEVLSLDLAHKYDATRDRNVILYELQLKYWELVMWLDADILRALHQRLRTGEDPAGTRHKDVLVAIRKLIVGSDDEIVSADIGHWDPK